MIRLLVADDDARVRAGLRMALAVQPDMTVVGEAANGLAAVELAAAVHPDVIVMDLAMPGMDGAAATSALRRMPAHCPVVMLSIYGDPTSRRRALDAGASAYVDKTAGLELLLQAIRGASTPRS